MNNLDHSAFNAKIKTKPFEQFSLLMFDFETSNKEQKNLIDQILFGDQNSAQSWLDYINYVRTLFPEQIMQLQRLVNKAISCVDENIYRTTKYLLTLHIIYASFKR